MTTPAPVPSPRPLRVAVVGVGHLGRHHLRKYAAVEGVRLVAAVDPSPAAREWAVKNASVPATESLGDIIGRVDAVTVATPTAHHLEVALPLIEAGIHVLVEKPITTTVAEARRLIEAARRRGVVLQIGHVERFNPGFRAVRDALAEPRFIEAHRLAPFRFRSMDIGVVQDLMIHDLDLILSVVRSPVVGVQAAGVNVISPGREDICNARITFQSGCVANVTASRVSVSTMRKVRFFCRDAYLSLDLDGRKAIIYKKSPALAMDQLKMRDVEFTPGMDLAGLDFFKYLTVREIPVDDGDALDAEVRGFVAACRGERPCEVPGEDGLAALEAAEEVVRALRTHARTYFPAEFAPEARA